MMYPWYHPDCPKATQLRNVKERNLLLSSQAQLGSPFHLDAGLFAPDTDSLDSILKCTTLRHRYSM